MNGISLTQTLADLKAESQALETDLHNAVLRLNALSRNGAWDSSFALYANAADKVAEAIDLIQELDEEISL